MKRRLTLAAGLLHARQLPFMDEPTVGIDPRSRRAVLDLILELKREGTTILYTTHDMAEAEELSDRVGIIDHGRLLAVGTCGELAHNVEGSEQLRLALVGLSTLIYGLRWGAVGPVLLVCLVVAVAAGAWVALLVRLGGAPSPPWRSAAA
jgi:ABC-type multidrug transport system ATPase subunit